MAAPSRRTFVLAAVLAACATDSSGPPTPVERVDLDVPTPFAVGTTIQLHVTLRDANGASLTGRTVSWSSTDSAVATVSGTGVVSGLTLGSAIITATCEGKSGSAAASVIAGPAAAFVFTTQPATVGAGALFASNVSVTARDAHGNDATSFTGLVTATIGSNPGGATLGGTTTVTAVNGVATYTDLHIDRSGSGYTLLVTSGSITSPPSFAFNVNPGLPVRVAFAALPGTARAGSAIAPAIVVNARDALGNPVPAYTGNVIIALAANPGGGILSGTKTELTVGGAATFADLSVNKASPGYTFAASAGGLVGDTSSALTILAGPVAGAHSSVVATPPSIMASTGASATAITVTARDVFDNLVSGAAVVLTGSGTGNTLTQPVAATDASGVATGSFSSTIAESKTIAASVAGVSVTQTAAVTVTPAVNGKLVFTSQPATAGAGAMIAPAVKVAVRDDFGNTFTTFTGNIVMALGANPGGSTLSGATTKAAVAGEATFSDLSLNKAAPGYTLVATAAAITSGTSGAFTITSGPVSATQSTVAVTPAGITASNGSSASTVTVTARDAFGNVIPGAAVVLSATGTANSLTQPAGPTNASGVATGTLSSTVAEPKTVSVTINGVLIAQQPTVTVSPASVAASKSAVTASPGSIAASSGGVTSAVAVTAKDTFGNVIPGLAVVLVATGTGNTVTQPPAVTDAFGIATGTLSSSAVGVKVVSAAVAGTAVTQTASVTVVPGEVSASQSALVAAPATITASSGTNLATITVTARDDQGNPIPGVNVVLGATGASNSLVQPAGPTNASGVTTGTISSTLAGARIISAAIDGTGIDQLDTVTVTAAALSGTAFFVQPTSMTVGTIMSPAVQVELRDQFGNRVTSATNGVALSFGANPGSGILSGGGAVAAVAGVATFSSLSVNTTATGYTLKATVGGLPDMISSAFNVTSGVVSAAQSTVTVLPASITAGSGTSIITVTARDAGGFAVVGAAVTLSVSGTGNTVTQPAGPADGNGVATGILTSTVAGSKTVTATANGVTITQKPVITVTPGPVSASVSTVSASPASIVASTGTSTITVTVKDALGNPITGSTVVLAATGSGNTLTQPSGTTGSNGVATGTLSSSATGTKTVSATAGGITLTQTAAVTVTSAGSSVTFVGAGDIADCGTTDDEATAALINAMPGVPVFALGDNAYPNGSTNDYKNCYNPSWGAFKSRTHPSAGNHEYNSTNAAPYFAYFGSSAGTAGQGYYSFDLGSWHIIVLNSNIASDNGSAQDTWLQADLAAHKNVCTLAYWHHPLYSSIGGTGSGGAVISSARRFWDVLYTNGADLVLAGHRHVYERLAPMKPDGTADPVNGIRTLIVGTGGESGGDLTNIFPLSEVREGRTFGVMKLILSANSYTWQFIPVAGSTFTDTGSGSCH